VGGINVDICVKCTLVWTVMIKNYDFYKHYPLE